ncbi:MAG: radical SAM family heme chaperone HemW [Pseudomonadota bacterium]
MIDRQATATRAAPMPMLPAEPAFGVYIHWPFCMAKCPYCDFNSHVWRHIDHPAWRDALLSELRHLRRMTGPRVADTIFFGGGTPSLMTPQTVASLIGEVDRLWGLSDAAEITLEANPTSVEAAKFQGYAAAGVNRVSLGVQSLVDADLVALGRMHTAAEAAAAYDVARRVFDRVSFDLIYARKGQTAAGWEAELTQALGMAVDHLSLYQLTIEPGTRFHQLAEAGKTLVAAPDLAAEMYGLTQAMTRDRGLPAYEVSNHAVPGGESQHNLLYWRGHDYAGAGPGAHGRLRNATGVREALETLRDPAGWLGEVRRAGHAVSVTERLSREDVATEYLMMSLRLTEGADLARFRRLGGRLRDGALAEMASLGLICLGGARVVATPRGRLVLDRLLAELLLP